MSEPAAPASQDVPALRLYDDALRTGTALTLHWSGGRRALDIPRWTAPADEADGTLLRRCGGPTLDVGCGPGRLVLGLVHRGVPVLGVDVAPGAVALARKAGAPVVHRSVFDRLPGEGRWRDVLLADGNVGIGGDPRCLLARVSRLLCDGGRLHAEVDAEDIDEVGPVQLEDEHGRRSAPFDWALLGAPALLRRAGKAGFGPVEDWTCQGRRFLTMQIGSSPPHVARRGALRQPGRKPNVRS